MVSAVFAMQMDNAALPQTFAIAIAALVRSHDTQMWCVQHYTNASQSSVFAAAQGITTGVASILVLVLVVGVCSAFIMGWWLGRRKMKKGLDQSKSLQNDLPNAAYDVPSSTMQTNPAYMTVEECIATY